MSFLRSRRFQASSSPLSLLMLSSVLSTVCYVGGQAVNFATQLLIMHVLGRDRFGLIGIAQMCVLSIIFIGELGMPSYFIREVRLRHDWLAEWRYARLCRLGILSLGAVLLMTGGQAYFHYKGFGFLYLVGALPGILGSAFNLAPLLVGQNRLRKFALGIPLQSLAVVCCSLVALHAGTQQPGLWLGLSFSMGYVVLYAFQRWRFRWPSLVRPASPRWQREMLRRTLTMWGPGLTGMLYSLLLTFSIEQTRPEIIAYFILATQVMQGISGINMQVQRIFLPAFASGVSGPDSLMARQVHVLLDVMIFAVMTLMLGIFFATGYFGGNPMILGSSPYFCLILIEWLISLLSSFLVTSLLAAHRERFISRLLVNSFIVSMALQVVLLRSTNELLYILIVRLATNGFQLLVLYRAVLGRNPYIYALCGGGLILAGVTTYSSIGALAMLTVCCAATLVAGMIFLRRCWGIMSVQVPETGAGLLSSSGISG